MLLKTKVPQFLTFEYVNSKNNFLIMLSLVNDNFVPSGLRCSQFVLQWTSGCYSLYPRVITATRLFILDHKVVR